MNRLVRRDAERGATAIIVAVAAVFLFSCGAMAVDLGNGFARKRDVQTQADFGALAGAASVHTLSAPTAADPAVQAAATYFVKNRPLSEGDPPDPSLTFPEQVAEMADALVDGDDKNGEVEYPSRTKIRVLSPYAHVNYGMASVLGYNSVDVQGDAAAGMFSPGSVMPVYAWQGCDYGLQTILTDSSPTPTPIPLLDEDDDDNGARVEKLDPRRITPVSPSSPVLLTINGAQMGGVTKVGFFRTDTTSPPAPEEVTPDPANVSNTKVTVVVPSAVDSVEAVWYVRVYKGGEWSSVDPTDIEPLPVGNVPLECDADSSSGNYGTLDFPRDDVSSQDDTIARNMAESLQFSLLPFPEGESECTTLGEGDGYIRPPNDDSNCISTKPGMPSLATTEGLITGLTAYNVKGKLDADTTSLCGGGRVDSGVDGVDINNDYLTCFLTDEAAADGVTIADIATANYDGDPVLSSEIFKSPRFFWQPVVRVEPYSGTSHDYTIIEFRPAFLTDQPLTADADNDEMGTSSNNGLILTTSAGNTRIGAVKVVFFDVDALPSTYDGAAATPYIGSGPQVIRLTN